MTQNPSISSIVHLHVVTFFVFFLTLPFHGNTQTNDPKQEQTILLKLKQHWSNPPSLTHWSPSSDHCTWPEITCNQGSVTKLEIIDRNITNTIPPFLCDLNNLTYINFNYNYIPGSFPTVLYNCSNLQYLDLSQNYMVGALPDDINKLSPRLQYLNLAGNNFTGDIPAAIGGLSSLVTLNLMSNLFNGSFPPEISNLSNLEELILNNNPFKPQSIHVSFTKLTKLRNFWMPGTNLIGEIPDAIGKISSLEFVDLSENNLSGFIPDGFFLLKNLTILFLFKNQLSGSIPRKVETLDLRVLDLSSNNLTGTIPDDFGKLKSLTGLALFFNHLSGEVPVSLGTLPQLIDFNLYSNNLSGELPPDFGRYSSLKRFQVSDNNFHGELPKHLCDNKVFIGLIAFENNLTGPLPDSLGDCDSLEIIRVHNNRLSGEIVDGLWTSLNLTTVMISDNLFTGRLPDKVTPRLSTLELMNNQFSGPIGNGLSSWEQLTVLKASNNLLSGEIPQEFTALQSVTTVLLDGNKLSGNFPSNIISWKSLTNLDLSRNQLTGELPSSLGLLPNLLYLDLSENQFSGRIPPELGHRGLPSLNLSSNKLSGIIPSEFENAAFDTSFLNNPGLCSNIHSLGLTSCRAETKKSNKFSSRFIAAASSIAAVSFLVSFIYTVYVYKRYRKTNHVSDSTWKVTSFQRLNFTEANILSNLKDENRIGSGGSGQVYRIATNQVSEYVAVKKIWENLDLDNKLEKEFVAEVNVLGSIRHSNIVKLLCCISGENSKLIVYEYMENGSVDRWIRRKGYMNMVLDWPKRLKIAIGAAHGLCYMHHYCSPPIIHRDIKSSNILLDSEFNAKIADFGLARMLIKNSEPNTMSVVAGSFGYMAPEYARTRRVNEKVDVYSFGVVLLELVTGREAHNGDETSSLAEWAWRHFQEGKSIIESLDEDINEPQYLEDIKAVFNLGLICTSTSSSSRPTMKDVVQILLRLQPPGDKTDRNEHDVVPLLHSSMSHRSSQSDDSDLISV